MQLLAQKCFTDFSRRESLLKRYIWMLLSLAHFVSTNNEAPHGAMLSSRLLLSPSYAQLSPSAPYELSKTLGLCYFLNMRDKVSHPHTKTGKIFVMLM
jgi:hypothetical protein